MNSGPDARLRRRASDALSMRRKRCVNTSLTTGRRTTSARSAWQSCSPCSSSLVPTSCRRFPCTHTRANSVATSATTASASCATEKCVTFADRVARGVTSSVPRRASTHLSKPRERSNEAPSSMCPLRWTLWPHISSSLVPAIL